VNRRRPRDPDDTASYAELKMYYKQLVGELDECKRNSKAASDLSRNRYNEAKEAKTEVRRVRKDLVTISRKQKAREEASKAGYWSGGAAVCVALFYEICKATNQWPGGRQYESVWTHEAMVSALTFLTTALFAAAYKSMHPESK
jgi:hypothetical protein